MRLEPFLLDILACPACRSRVRADETAGELVCTNPACGLAYPVRDDIPVMLIDEARRPAPPAVRPAGPPTDERGA